MTSIGHRLAGSERPILLMYHRVGDFASDPWQLAVTPSHFSEHLEVLKEERDVVPLPWLVRELREGRAPRRAVALTFDDGYADVLLNAKPILEKHNCPAMVFLTTGGIGDNRGFWWDTLARILLESGPLPDHLILNVRGHRYTWRLTQLVDRRTPAGALSRSEFHIAVWQSLRPLESTVRRSKLEELAAWAGTNVDPRPEERSLLPEEACQLSAPGFIDIGAHTVTHPSLPMLGDEDKFYEINESRRACEDLTGLTVEGFSYPFGNVDKASISAVRKSGLHFACTTAPGCATAGANLLQLPRVAVADWDKQTFYRKVLRYG